MNAYDLFNDKTIASMLNRQILTDLEIAESTNQPLSIVQQWMVSMLNSGNITIFENQSSFDMRSFFSTFPFFTQEPILKAGGKYALTLRGRFHYGIFQ